MVLANSLAEIAEVSVSMAAVGLASLLYSLLVMCHLYTKPDATGASRAGGAQMSFPVRLSLSVMAAL